MSLQGHVGILENKHADSLAKAGVLFCVYVNFKIGEISFNLFLPAAIVLPFSMQFIFDYGFLFSRIG